jgi:hypothetical protein
MLPPKRFLSHLADLTCSGHEAAHDALDGAADAADSEVAKDAGAVIGHAIADRFNRNMRLTMQAHRQAACPAWR